MAYEELLNQAKYLKEKWDSCIDDKERLILCTKHPIELTLDNDNTTAAFVFNTDGLTKDEEMNVFEEFGCPLLDDYIGNSCGVLLDILNIKWRYC